MHQVGKYHDLFNKSLSFQFMIVSKTHTYLGNEMYIFGIICVYICIYIYHLCETETFGRFGCLNFEYVHICKDGKYVLYKTLTFDQKWSIRRSL